MRACFRPLVRLAAVLASLAGMRAAEFEDRIAGFSARLQFVPDAPAPSIGFNLGAGAPKTVLLRAIGPGLRSFGLTGVLADPRLDLFSAGSWAAGNDNWSLASVGGGGTFAKVGASGLTTGSADAAFVATLAPGNHAAQATVGTGANQGLAQLEVHDVDGAGRLLNVSVRARVGGAAGQLTADLGAASGRGPRQILVRVAGPALRGFGVADALEQPTLAILDRAGFRLAENERWEEGNASALAAAFARAGAFPFAPGSRDAAAIVDLPAGGNLVFRVGSAEGPAGSVLLEAYDLTVAERAIVDVVAATPTTDARGAAPAVFLFSRSGDAVLPLTVYFRLSGQAAAGADFLTVPQAVTIPAGSSIATVNLVAIANPAAASARDVRLTVVPGPDYGVGGAGAATATIFQNPGTLYLAALRPAAGAGSSVAFGMARLQLSADETQASIAVEFSNLSSAQTAAYLRLSAGGDDGVELFRLPEGQVPEVQWVLSAQGGPGATGAIRALKEGRLFLRIDSADYPAGELRGAFAAATGALNFTPPPPVPVAIDHPLTAAQAARFLVQATFGPTQTEIEALTGARRADLEAWLDAQMESTPSLHHPATLADHAQYTARESVTVGQPNRQAAWWKHAVTAPDQLRQRVAFALSEIFVVSDTGVVLAANAGGANLANYYDILVRGAFGDFRRLLEEVTLSPVMGHYLGMLRNAQATFDGNGVALTSPDENYAREVMQLFTIGLHQLHPDGTLKLDPTGRPIPTYDQKVIAETARVFTGWSYYSATAPTLFRNGKADWFAPMMLYPEFHDAGAKTIVGGRVLPARQGGAKDLADVLDALAEHPNTGPFIGRQLIQRLVTSNPSPGYVYRVARAFADNGRGDRGDLGAVVRAILLDHEARAAEVAGAPAFGKLKEPLLRVTALLRAFAGGTNSGRYYGSSVEALINPEVNLAQAALRSPSVFNFFEPAHVPPGRLAAAGLQAPEFQITTQTTTVSVPNALWSYIYARRPANAPDDFRVVGLDLTPLLPLAREPAALLERLNTILAAGSLSPAVIGRFTSALAAMPAGTGPVPDSPHDLERVRSAVYLVATSPAAAVQK